MRWTIGRHSSTAAYAQPDQLRQHLGETMSRVAASVLPRAQRVADREAKTERRRLRRTDKLVSATQAADPAAVAHYLTKVADPAAAWPAASALNASDDKARIVDALMSHPDFVPTAQGEWRTSEAFRSKALDLIAVHERRTDAQKILHYVDEGATVDMLPSRPTRLFVHGVEFARAMGGAASPDAARAAARAYASGATSGATAGTAITDATTDADAIEAVAPPPGRAVLSARALAERTTAALIETFGHGAERADLLGALLAAGVDPNQSIPRRDLRTPQWLWGQDESLAAALLRRIEAMEVRLSRIQRTTSPQEDHSVSDQKRLATLREMLGLLIADARFGPSDDVEQARCRNQAAKADLALRQPPTRHRMAQARRG